MVGSTTKPTSSLDLDGVGSSTFDLGPHGLQEDDEVVYFGLLGGRTDHGVPIGERGRQHRVLGAHHGDVGELHEPAS